jgi:DNA-binding LytR/AlgR family response regulator
LNELNFVEALGDYVRLITNDKKYTVLSTMKAFDAKLPSDIFMRVHKSFIINLRKIERIEKNVVHIDDLRIPISRTYKEGLKKRLTTL